MNNNDLNQTRALNLMLRWNHYCDTHNCEGDCILLNEDRTYIEAFENEDHAMREIVNSREPDFKRNEGFLVPVWSDEGRYAGMRYVPFDKISERIDLTLLEENCLTLKGLDN